MSRVRSLIGDWFPVQTRLFRSLLTLRDGHGQKLSIRSGKPVDAAGNPIPWYTYPAIEYLQQFDLTGAQVFEFGSGNSSLFWAQRCLRVVAVESDSGWFAEVSKRAQANLELHLREQRAEYVACLREQSTRFDVIVIDGRWRHSCARQAGAQLAEGGFILFDNTDWHPKSAQTLRQAGFFQVDFSGFGPINGYSWTTSIFIRAPVRLQHGFSNPRPIGGLIQDGAEDS